MDIDFISDPNLIPKPRASIRIERLNAVLSEDGTRARISLEITPFAPADRPNIEVSATSQNGAIVGDLTVIETMQRSIALTMHLRDLPNSLQGEYEIKANLFYADNAPQSSAIVTISHENSSASSEPPQETATI